MTNNRLSSRREALITGAAAATALACPAIVRGRDLNSKLRIGVVGMGGRANSHVNSLTELEQSNTLNIELAAVCDCDKRKVENAQRNCREKLGHEVTGHDDMRRLLDDKSIDAVTYATPNHWHALGAIWGCQAGKDVYVEKPGSHNIFEGRKMVEAARKYGRIVQHGTQCRSSANIVEGMKHLHDGLIGDVYMGRGVAFKIRRSHGRNEIRETPPALNWDAFCGPAPLRPYSTFNQTKWHWIWDFGNGEIGNQGVHQMDLLRWGMKIDDHPTTISAMGTNYIQENHFKSDAETPGLLSSMMKWPDGKMITFEVRDWYTNAEAGFRDQYPFVQKDFPVGAIFLGTKGTMIFPDYSSYYSFLGDKREPGPSAFQPGSPISDTPHFRNWILAVRSRNPDTLSADILQGHMSSALCHLSNIAYRVDETLHFDAVTEQFKGNEKASALVSRIERAPYAVPVSV
ncbi:MAG: Gfo/Idh/MocA family oxidoreductase [Pirellulaceae bacterium]|nr:Gfo/Idh/MocA family oxidoreductase [Pirellulaceae bacterium]